MILVLGLLLVVAKVFIIHNHLSNWTYLHLPCLHRFFAEVQTLYHDCSLTVGETIILSTPLSSLSLHSLPSKVQVLALMHPLIMRFMKGTFELKTSLPRYSRLLHASKQSDKRSLTLKDLSLCFVTLRLT